jgi:hypothetical protein
LRVLTRSRRFHFYILRSPSPRAADAALAALGALLPARRAAPVTWERIDPYPPADSTSLQHQPALLRVLEPLVAEINPPSHGRIVVVDASQSSESEISRWATIFQRMNELRNTIVDRTGGELLLCLPPWLYETFAIFAPDFWSIRSDEFVLPDPPAPPLPWWHHPVFGRTIHRIMAVADGFSLEEIPSGSELTALADRLRGTSKIVRLGEQLLDLGRYEEARAVLFAAAPEVTPAYRTRSYHPVDEPDFRMAWIARAEALLQVGDEEGSARALEIAINDIGKFASNVYASPLINDFLLLVQSGMPQMAIEARKPAFVVLDMEGVNLVDHPPTPITLGLAATMLSISLLLFHRGNQVSLNYLDHAIQALSFPAAQAPTPRLLPHRAALLALALLHKARFRLAAHDDAAALAALDDAAPWIVELADTPAVADVHATLRAAERELRGEVGDSTATT